ncbi:MAG: hypothetical protein FWF29_11450 [Treponema sp.]|nr:hypothetical protein [Treponema sp.]
MVSEKDKLIIRELAKKTAEIAALPVQEEKRRLWRRLNGLRPERPMVMIDQVCWSELESDDLLKLRCEDEECRSYETRLRRNLYQWKHFPVDMVIEPFIPVPKATGNTGLGIEPQNETLASDPDNPVVARKWISQLETDEDLEKITVPKIKLDVTETDRRLSVAKELFDGILEARAVGEAPFVQVWDAIAEFRGVGNTLNTLVEDPDFIHRIIQKMILSLTGMFDQLEDQGLLCDMESYTLIHCTGAYTDELPAPGYKREKPRCKDIWTGGLAQMLSTVSPAMHQEYELDYCNPLFARFGLVYYGCCDPLDRKMDIVSKIPNLRKVSMSPWTDPERGAEGIGKKFVFSSKPNPAFLAWDVFSEEQVKGQLTAVKNACDKNGCPLEFILKDISTVYHEPWRLDKWAELAMQTAMA